MLHHQLMSMKPLSHLTLATCRSTTMLLLRAALLLYPLLPLLLHIFPPTILTMIRRIFFQSCLLQDVVRNPQVLQASTNRPTTTTLPPVFYLHPHLALPLPPLLHATLQTLAMSCVHVTITLTHQHTQRIQMILLFWVSNRVSLLPFLQISTVVAIASQLTIVP